LRVRVVRRIHSGLSLKVDLRLGPEIGVVFGESGAGKSSLLRLIAGLSRPDTGEIRLDGRPLFDATGPTSIDEPLRRRRVGMIFQEDLLFPHRNVARNIDFGLSAWPRDQARSRRDEVAELCGVGHLLDRFPESLSGGERQRVGLARALAPRPRLLLCDEPVSALDLAGRFALLERLAAAQRAEKIPVLYVTHSPAEAIVLGSRLFLLEEGRIVAEGPPLDVLASHRAHPARLAHLEGICNVFPAEVAAELSDRGSTRLKLDNGPILTVPAIDEPAGSKVLVEVRADDILLARSSIEGLSARNQIPGIVDRIVPHGEDAEVVVRTGPISWIVSVVATAALQLGLAPGEPVCLIVKARSCRILDRTGQRAT
jgi:molybdate transport system ATP-binding protein